MTRLTRVLALVVLSCSGVLIAATPAHAAGTQTVNGYTESECEARGSAVAHDLINAGYQVTFVGCFLTGVLGPAYTGTVYYR